MTYDSSNVFARILRGEAPAYVIAETEHTLSFMDVMPQAEGHALVIPKEPATNLFEISDAALQTLILEVKRLAKAAKRAYPDKGIRVFQLNDALAGQSVFHLHFHVLPSADGANFAIHRRSPATAEELAPHIDRLKRALEELD